MLCVCMCVRACLMTLPPLPSPPLPSPPLPFPPLPFPPRSCWDRFYIGRTPFLVTSDPEMVKEITIKQFDSFSDRTVSRYNCSM